MTAIAQPIQVVMSPQLAALVADLLRRQGLTRAPEKRSFRERFGRILKTLFIANAHAQTLLTATKTAIDAGSAAVIEIYDGTAPTDADTSIGAQVKLATLTMSATAFGSVSDDTPGAIMTAAAITADSSADASGTASWFRLSTQAGGTVIFQGTVGTSGADINFNTVSFTSGSEISISALTVFQGES